MLAAAPPARATNSHCVEPPSLPALTRHCSSAMACVAAVRCGSAPPRTCHRCPAPMIRTALCHRGPQAAATDTLPPPCARPRLASRRQGPTATAQNGLSLLRTAADLHHPRPGPCPLWPRCLASPPRPALHVPSQPVSRRRPSLHPSRRRCPATSCATALREKGGKGRWRRCGEEKRG